MSEIGDIPLIGGIAQTAVHGAEAVGNAVQGDWEGAAHEAFNTSASALHTAADAATGGLATAAEGVYDAAAPGLGLPSSDQISHSVEQTVQDAGGAIGQGVYDITHDDSLLSGLGGPLIAPLEGFGDLGGLGGDGPQLDQGGGDMGGDAPDDPYGVGGGDAGGDMGADMSGGDADF